MRYTDEHARIIDEFESGWLEIGAA